MPRPQTSDAAQAVAALTRLERDVFIYRSLGEFEENRKLARVSLPIFENDLREMTNEVEPVLARLPDSKLKAEIENALASFRDGAFWWSKIYQTKVLDVSALTYRDIDRSDTALIETAPYTVAVYWRQAAKYLKRAETLLNRER